MGLDAVESIMEVEDAFHIKITDADASNMRTVGDLFDHVWSKVRRLKANACTTSRIFDKLRRAAMNVLRIDRRDIRPDSPWSELLDANDVRDQWLAMSDQLPQPLPRLNHPRWALWATTLSAFAGVLLGTSLI